MNSLSRFILFLIVLIVFIPFSFFSACSDDDDDTPIPTATPTATNTPTATPVPNTPPETTIISGPDIATEFPIDFTFSGVDAEDGTELLEYSYRVDELAWSTWQSETTATLSGLAQGEHTFYVKARDTELLEDPTPAEWEFTVNISSDEQAPETWIISGPSGEIHESDVTYLYSGSDDETPTNELVFSYVLDNEGWSDYSATTEVTLSALSEGIHYFSVRAKDSAGNVDPTPDSRSFTIVLNYYELTMSPAQQTQVIDPGEEAEFRVDFQNTGTYQTTFTFHLDISGLPNGWSAIYCLSNGQCAVGDVDLELAIGESDYMVMHITASTSATSGQTGSTTLSATCDADSSFYVSSTGTARIR